MRQLIPIALCLFLLAAPVRADEGGQVRDLLKSKIDAVVVLLQDGELDKERRDAHILEIVEPIFDYPTMAKLSLGKKHWPGLSEEKQAAFSELFIDRLQQSYLEKLDLYTDESILYGQPQVEGNKVHVPTTLIARDSRIGMLYKFYRSGGGWHIYDVEIGGVSVIQTYRSQFDGVLSDGTIDDLLERLRTDGASFVIPAPEEPEGRPGPE